MDRSPPDPHRVPPAKHRGREVGILSKWFRLEPRGRYANDHRGPVPLPRDPGDKR